MPWWQQPFIQIALPIILTIAIATWFQNKRVDEVSKRIDDVNLSLGKRIDDLKESVNKRLDLIEQRLARIEDLLMDHDRRITAL